MPLSPADRDRRNLITEAVTVLQNAERSELGDAVNDLVTRSGVDFIKRVLTSEGGNRNLSVKIPGHLWTELAPHEADGRFPEIIERAFQSFLKGEFDVQHPRRASRGMSSTPHTVNPSLPAPLQAEVSRRCRELHEADPESRLRVSTVAALALYQHFEIGPYAPDAASKIRTKEKVGIYLASDRRDAIRNSGVPARELAQIVNEGLRRFLDGTFDLRLPNRPTNPSGQGAPGKPINLFLDSDLMQATKERFAEIQEERQIPGYYGTTSVAAAVLYEHFGLAPYASDAGA